MLPLLLLSTLAFADPKPAPELAITQWVRGDPVDFATPGQTFVVEVWATWCEPCRETFPELSALQKLHGDKLVVVGLTDEDPMRVRRFYDNNRAVMRYRIATDTTGESVRALMWGDFGGSGIPSSYILRDGKVLWGGPPKELEEAIKNL